MDRIYIYLQIYHLFADLHLFQIYFYLQNFIYLHKDMNFLADGIRNLSL